MEVKTRELDENKIIKAVQYAVSTSFSLDQLSNLLVMEGGVDLDTLSRIIRENRGDASEENVPASTATATATASARGRSSGCRR